MAKKLLCVVGATGAQGGSLVNTVLSDPKLSQAWNIRGLTRNTSSEAAKELQNKGVEVVQAELGDISSLVQAFKGADVVYGVTDYWVNASKDDERQQGINIADACKEQGCYLIFSSLPHVSKLTDGKCTSVLNFDSKAEAEIYIRKIGIPAAFVNLGFYCENIPGFGLQLDEGASDYVLRMPCPETTCMPFIDCRNDLGKFVVPIIKDLEGFRGKTIFAGTEPISLKETARIYNEFKPAGWKKARFEEKEHEAWTVASESDLDFTGDTAIALAAKHGLLGEKGFFGAGPLEPSLALLEQQPRTWKDFVQDVNHPAWSNLK